MVDWIPTGKTAKNGGYRDLRPALSNLEEWKPVMVGMGNQCEDDGWRISGSCPSCGHKVSLVKSGCGKVECPRCFRTWARRAAERSAARVWGAKLAGVVRNVPRHFTFEVDSLDWSEAKSKALALGCTGGILVIHPWRIKKEYQAMFEIMAERCGVNRYDIVRESAIGMDALEWAPHAHVLGYGRLIDVEKGQENYLYRMIGPRYSMMDCEGTLFYLFGHTFQPEKANGKAARYFGICSPSRLKPEWTGTCTETLRCPCCNEPVLAEDGISAIWITKYASLGWHVVTPGKRRAPMKGAEIPVPMAAESFMLPVDARESRVPRKNSACPRAPA